MIIGVSIFCILAFQCLSIEASFEGANIGSKSKETCENSSNTESSTTLSDINDCSAPCLEPLSNFCSSMKMDDCTCQEVCCALPECSGSGVDWENCNSCSNCPCLPVTNTTDCSVPCPEASSKFCFFTKMDDCSCIEACCDLPQCENTGIDWDNCHSCDHCPCLPPTTTTDCSVPCPESSSNFCINMKMDDCTCQEVCCAPPACIGSGVDWDNCRSCFDCPCLLNETQSSTTDYSTLTESLTESTPIICPIQECPPSEFCSGERNEHCLCEYFCCYPYCPDGEQIDWDHCYSCDNCTCLPDIQSSTITTKEPCAITCEDRPGFISTINYEICACDYSYESTVTQTTPCAITCEDRPNCTTNFNSDLCSCEYFCSTKTTRRNRWKCKPVGY